MKIFLTADNHIGLKYANHSKSQELCEERISSFQRMIDKANQECCSLFVIAGDLFDNSSSIPKKTIYRLLEMLSLFNGSVAILPGNHDYYSDASKLWKDFKEIMDGYDNILLLTEYRCYPVPCGDDNVVLYPALCTSRHSECGKNNLDWIKEINIDDDGAYHIGIAHGAVEGETIDKEGTYFLMRRDELDQIPVDVWLIGHTHIPFPRNLSTENTTGHKIFNAGTHVQTDVSCNTEGQCFIIEIDKSKNVSAKKYVSGNIRFYRKNINLTAGNMESILERELADIDDNSVVDIILDGNVSADEYENRNIIIDNVLSRFLEGTSNDYNLSKLISKEFIDSEFPETSFSARFLTLLLDNPKEAQLAYELVKSLKS